MEEIQDKVYSENSVLLIENYTESCRYFEKVSRKMLMAGNVDQEIIYNEFEKTLIERTKLADYIKSLEDKLKEAGIEI